MRDATNARNVTKLHLVRQARTVGNRYKLLLADRNVYTIRENSPVTYQDPQAGFWTLTNETGHAELSSLT